LPQLSTPEIHSRRVLASTRNFFVSVRVVVPALLVLLGMTTAARAAVPVSAGGTPETFAQLVTRDIVPSPGASPTVTASATMSVDSSSSCVYAEPTFNNASFSPSFVAGSVPIDADSYPVQFTYFSSRPYSASPGYVFDYIAVALLDVSCSVTPAGGSASAFRFQVPIYLCTIPKTDPTLSAIGLSTSGCAITTIPAGCTIPSAGVVASGGYAHNSETENLKVYQPPSPTTSPEETPAIAVDLQLFYNGFTVAGAQGFSPYLVRVACSSLSAFTNQ
jgi:hypothetical protein